MSAAVATGYGSPTEPSQSSRCPVPPYVALSATDVWPCPPAAAIADIDAKIHLEFVDDPTAGTLVCYAADGSADLTRLQERAYQTLYLLKRLQFDSPLPWTTESLWEWFTSGVKTIQYLRTTSPPGYRKSLSRIEIPVHDSANYGAGFPTDVSGLVHEARHAQKPHTCWARTSACSATSAWNTRGRRGRRRQAVRRVGVIVYL